MLLICLQKYNIPPSKSTVLSLHAEDSNPSLATDKPLSDSNGYVESVDNELTKPTFNIDVDDGNYTYIDITSGKENEGFKLDENGKNGVLDITRL